MLNMICHGMEILVVYLPKKINLVCSNLDTKLIDTSVIESKQLLKVQYIVRSKCDSLVNLFWEHLMVELSKFLRNLRNMILLMYA